MAGLATVPTTFSLPTAGAHQRRAMTLPLKEAR